MEYWNDVLAGRGKKSVLSAFKTHHSNIPTLHHSMWIAQIDRNKKYDFNTL
jgi:hypothetical protein